MIDDLGRADARAADGRERVRERDREDLDLARGERGCASNGVVGAVLRRARRARPRTWEIGISNISVTPRPVGPSTPNENDSSKMSRNLNSFLRATSSGSGTTSPQLRYNPSAMMKRRCEVGSRRCFLSSAAMASSSVRRCAMSLWTNSCTLARESVMPVRSGSCTPASTMTRSPRFAKAGTVEVSVDAESLNTIA